MKKIVLILSLFIPDVTLASDFSILMWLLLVPFIIASAVVWAITWPLTSEIKNRHFKAIIRIAGLCLIFTPTFTHGGNGQMLSVAMYDFVMSLLGGDVIYAKQALVNVIVATPVVYLLYFLSTVKSKNKSNNSQ